MSRRTRQSRRKKRPAPESALAAFSDIAFLLIIFFIVTANLTKPEGMITDIPAAQEGQETDDKMPSVVLDGRSIMLNEDKLPNFAVLRQRLMEMKLPERENPEDRIVELEAKDDVAYQDYFQAMTAISKAGGQVTIVQRSDDAGGKGGGE